MAKILLIETATEICSVGLWDQGLVAERRTEEDFQHTSGLTLLIEGLIKEAGWAMDELDAVAVSGGPGSYTALRVGAATAKGICYAGNIPLIAIDTLAALAGAISQQVSEKADSYRIVPMIDARRMEAYIASYDEKGACVLNAQAMILDAEQLKSLQNESDALYIGGSGAEKCRELLVDGQEIVVIACAAGHLGPLAEVRYKDKNFEDLAYFSPNYIKPPNITTPKPIWRNI